MGNFRVKISNGKLAEEKIDNVKRAAINCMNSASSAKSNLRMQIKQRSAIDSRLSGVIKDLSHHADSLGNFSSQLDMILQKYEETERSLLPGGGDLKGDHDRISEETRREKLNYDVSHCTTLSGLLINGYLNRHKSTADDGSDISLNPETSGEKIIRKSAENNYFYYEDDKTSNGKRHDADWINKKNTKENKRKKAWDKNLTVGYSHKISSEQVTVKKRKEFKTKNGKAGGSSDFALFKRYYSLDSEINNEGINFGAECGVTAVEYDVTGSIGGQYTNLFGKINVKADDLKAGASVGLGWKDKNGKFDPRLKAKLNAKAILAAVSGTIGGEVMGIKGNVTATAEVGIGVKMNFELNNGKLTYDFGAACGPGFNLSGDIDVSDAVDAITSGTESVRSMWEDFLNIFKNDSDKTDIDKSNDTKNKS